MVKMKIFLALKLAEVAIILLINVKMPTIVGILTFMSKDKLHTLRSGQMALSGVSIWILMKITNFMLK